MNAAEKGKAGEALAARYLEEHGYLILERNFRCRHGELDLVAQKGELIVFAEVKLRRDDRFLSAMEAVTVQKRQRLRLAAQEWMAQKACVLPARFDVIEIYSAMGRLRHIVDAFQ